MTGERRQTWAPFLVAALATIAVAAVGNVLTDLGPWYQALEKPSWQPPRWAFPLAWTTIFTLAAGAAALAWRGASTGARRAAIVGFFAINGALNILWSALFFQLQRPDWALIENVFLWLSVASLIVVVARASRAAVWLLVPYLAWVTVAGYLNFTVVRLNEPFPGA